MNASLRLCSLLLIILLLPACATQHDNRITAEIKTTEGDIKIALSDLTPLHRDNFVKLAESGFYDGVLFHRVIKDFMIQTGDGSTKAAPGVLTEDYIIPAEINDSLYHRRGVVAAAREGDDVNPARNSSGTQFYIVQGKKYNDEDMAKAEQRIDKSNRQYIYYKALEEERAAAKNDTIAITEDEIQQNAIMKLFDITQKEGPYQMPAYRREIYRNIGGTPFLDGAYTVFGEVIEGMDVVDMIANTSTDLTDKPYKDIRIIKIKITRK